MIDVTQIDRDAAADYLFGGGMVHSNNPVSAQHNEHMREGILDKNPLVQAFARHRSLNDEGVRELRDAASALLAVSEMTTFSDQYPGECARLSAALEQLP